ncbi:TonB-dependent receptor [Sphingomonas sp. GB1N7]|uniref:TonB-dependent receptor n=1 Tax=Parasphingomonas caseinilytica TaxID=3096158 RepID=UPI002FCA360E
MLETLSKPSRLGLRALAMVGASTTALTACPAIAQIRAGDAQDVTAGAAAPASSVPDADTDAAPGLDIVVTAQKRSELLRNVPISVAALSGDQLAQSNIARMTDLVAVVPNLTLSLAALQPITFVRGFGTTGSFSFEQAVGKFVDNVSYGRDFDGRYPLYDLERLEVLKGPQVLLYGNSSTAGAINISTRKPGATFEADGSVAYEFNAREVLTQGGLTLPIAENVSLRVSGIYQRLAKGWIHNTLTNEDEPTYRNFGGRAILRIEPVSAVEILLKVEVNRTQQLGSTAQPITQGVLPAAQFTDPLLDDNRAVSYEGAPFFTRDQNAINFETYQGDVNWTVGSGTLTSTTAYRKVRAGNTETGAFQRPLLTLSSGQRYNQFSQELRYAGTAGAFDFIAGGYFERNNAHVFVPTNLNLGAIGAPVPPFARVTTYDQRASSYSPFGQLTYRLTSDLRISAGARFTVVRKTTDQALFGANFIPNISFATTREQVEAASNPAITPLIRNVLGGTVHAFTGIRTREEHFQPQVVAQYDFAPRNMAFVKYVKGDKAGGVDATYTGTAVAASPAQAQFAPEKAVSFEGGIKGLVLNGKLEYALTAYTTTFTDLQTSAFVGTVLFVTNVGRARTRGVEFEAHARPVTGLSIDGTANFQNAKYLSFPNAPCTVGQTPLPPAAAVPCSQDLSGAPTPFNSKYSGSFGVRYELPVSDFRLLGGWNILYRSRYNTSTNNDPLGNQKGLFTLDAHLDLKPRQGLWTLSLFGRNITNEKYKEYSVAAPLIRGGFNTYLSRGAQVGMRLSVDM